MDTLTTVAKFVASLGEAVASGPYFKVMLVNLLPGQILQPFVDSAFKKRGIDPEKFWRRCGPARLAVPRPERAAVPERRPGAGADAAGGHAGASRTRGAQGLAVLVHAAGRRPATTRQPAAVCRSDHRSVRRPRIRPARRGHLEPEPERSWLHAGCARRGHPGSDAAGHARRTRAVAAGPARRAHGPVGPAARTAGLHAGHRAAAACADRSAAAARTGSRRWPGGYAAAARQPAVPPARIAGGG